MTKSLFCKGSSGVMRRRQQSIGTCRTVANGGYTEQSKTPNPVHSCFNAYYYLFHGLIKRLTLKLAVSRYKWFSYRDLHAKQAYI